jgi:hypothetical protein
MDYISSAGTGIENAASGLAQSTGLSDVASGIQSLFQPSESQRIADLGQPVPQGVDIVGPQANFQGPGFLQGMAQGFMHTLGNLGPDASSSSQLGGGLGEFLRWLDQQRGGKQSQTLPAIVGLASGVSPIQVVSGPSALAPQSGLVHRLISSATYGILDTPKMSS